MHSDLRRDDGSDGNEVNEPSFVREDRNGKLHFDDAADAEHRREKAMSAPAVPAGRSTAILYRPFDATDDYDCGFATEAEMGLADIEFANRPAGPIGGPAGMLANGIVIHAPSGPMRIALGYSVYAVKLDEHDEVITGQMVSGPGLRVGAAAILAEATALHPERIPFDANFVIVNDGAGKTIEKFPMLRIAA
jgi:hypothetical protein